MSGGLILDLFGFPMGSPIPYRIASELPARPPVTAGTHEPERVTPYNVAREHIIPQPGLTADDSDCVKHGTSVNPQEIWNKRVRAGGERYTAAENAERERNRLARLARFQRQP